MVNDGDIILAATLLQYVGSRRRPEIKRTVAQSRHRLPCNDSGGAAGTHAKA
jgi:hypothetical protein